MTSDQYFIRQQRSLGFVSRDEQKILRDSTVAIGGVGGDGYELGLSLAMSGIGRLTVADPEVFEPENSNRVIGATVNNYGVNKAVAFQAHVKKIRPDTEVKIYTDGVTEDNVEEFISDADLVCDETELTSLNIGAMIAKAARQKGISNLMVMNIGFAAQVTSFLPESKYTFERFMGIPEEMKNEDIAQIKLPISRCVPYIPYYGDLDTLKAVQNGSPLPSIAQGVAVAVGLGSTQALLHLLNGQNNRKKPIISPRVGYQDSYDLRKSGTTRFPRAMHYRTLSVMAIRHSLGLNPKADYI